MSAEREALERIQRVQPATLEWLREKEIVFDKAPAFGELSVDSRDYWQQIAFTLYTDLCEVESIARQALAADTPESVAEKMQGVHAMREAAARHGIELT